jgi:rRNA-processing protein FCF1
MADPGTSRPKLVALDTNVLLHLAEDHAPAKNLVLRLIRLGYTPIATQTVVQELAYASQHGDVKKKISATRALSTMRENGIQPGSLKPVGNGICDVAANIIESRKLLPEGERNDAYILIEGSFHGVAMLITWDGDLLTANNTALNDVLLSLHLNRVQIVHPDVILA